jgi:uncharacterized protein YdhG (YjbR/CyaY superfamily)
MAGPETVEEYYAHATAAQRRGLRELSGIVKALAPEATETLSYRMPAFKLHGRILVWFAAFKDHYSLFPVTDAVLAAVGKEGRKHVAGKGTFHLPADEPIDAALVERFVKARLAEHEVHRRRPTATQVHPQRRRI